MLLAFILALAEATCSTGSLVDWFTLNRTVGGRLSAATPLALPCFSRYNNRSVAPEPTVCDQIQSNYTSASFRVGKYAAAMQTEWEGCSSIRDQCLLDSTNPRNPVALTGNCGQGSVSPHYINIETPADIQAAFAFSKKTGVALSVKNTGHDYMGRSHRRDSLALWMHNLNSMAYSAAFTPEGCNGSFRAITIGAGVIFGDLYEFADVNNVTFIGGYAPTIGASGGWFMGGGHSVLSPVYGLGVDRVLQIKVVTPDGQYRIANKCQNSDLFWALRGGGGGTFGVVIESSHRIEPKLTLQIAVISFTPTVNNTREFFQILVNNTVKWANEGWGGHITDGGMVYVNPKLSPEDATLSMKPAIDYSVAQGGTGILESSAWLEFFNKFVVTSPGRIGQIRTLGTRLLPKVNFESDSGREQLVDLLMLMRETLIYIPVVTPALYNETSPSETSVTPAWRSALWHVSQAATWSYNATVPEIVSAQSNLHDFVQRRFKAVAPDSGAYLGEADVYETDHEESFWGSNYPRLAQIKAK